MVSRAFVCNWPQPMPGGSGGQRGGLLRAGQQPARLGGPWLRWRCGGLGDWRDRGPRIANGAPFARGAVARTRPAGLPSVHLLCRGRQTMVCALVAPALLRPLFACHGTPPAAGRAWVPGFRVRTIGPCFLCTGRQRLWKACGVMDSLSQLIEGVACPQLARPRGPAAPGAGRMPSSLVFHRLCGAPPGFRAYGKLALASCPGTLDGCACAPAA
jgi:hypothetical protein